MRTTTSFVAALGLAATSGLLGGCSSGRSLTENAPAKGLDLGVLLPAEGMLSSEIAYSSDPIVARYQRFKGGSSRPEARLMEMRVEPDGEGWRVSWWKLPKEEGREASFEHRLDLRRGGDNSVLATGGFGEPGDFELVFEPPVRVAPALMKEDERLRSEFVAHAVEGDGEEAGSGPSRQWVRYAGRQTIDTPLGTFDADVILTSWDINWGKGHILREERTWVATVRPGRTTIVAQDITEESDGLLWDGTRRERWVIESIER